MAYRLPFPTSTIPTGGTFGDRTPPRTAPHRGTDFSYVKGARGLIPSVCRARLVAKGWSSVVGWWSEWQSLEGDGVYFTYCHCATNTALPVGTVREAGQSIGQAVGNTGSASRGAHCHLALSRTRGGGLSGAVQDPYAYIVARSSSGAGGDVTPITPEQEEDEDMLIEGLFSKINGADSWLVMNWATGEYRVFYTQEEGTIIAGSLPKQTFDSVPAQSYLNKFALFQMLAPKRAALDTAAIIAAVKSAVAEQGVTLDLAPLEAKLDEQFAKLNANIDDQPTTFTLSPA